MNQLQIFNSPEFGQVRTLEINNKPYFVASDIAKSLGYRNIQDAIIRHCRWVVKHDVPHPQSKDKKIEVNVIPEGDIYRLVSHSELPSAEKFETWVFDDVLPTIRKHGMYATDELLNNPDLLIAIATQLKEEKEARILAEQKVIEMKPKAEYFDDLVERNLLTNFRDTAKELGLSEKYFINYLIEQGYIYRDQKKKLKPYANKNKGLFEIKEFSSRFSEHSGVQTLITPKGRETFRILLKGACN